MEKDSTITQDTLLECINLMKKVQEERDDVLKAAFILWLKSIEQKDAIDFCLKNLCKNPDHLAKDYTKFIDN
jgi:hypothetical protein